MPTIMMVTTARKFSRIGSSSSEVSSNALLRHGSRWQNSPGALSTYVVVVTKWSSKPQSPVRVWLGTLPYRSVAESIRNALKMRRPKGIVGSCPTRSTILGNWWKWQYTLCSGRSTPLGVCEFDSRVPHYLIIKR